MPHYLWKKHQDTSFGHECTISNMDGYPSLCNGDQSGYDSPGEKKVQETPHKEKTGQTPHSRVADKIQMPNLSPVTRICKPLIRRAAVIYLTGVICITRDQTQVRPR